MTTFSRRRFLKTTTKLSAFAAFAAPAIAAVKSSNDKVSIAVIGCGGRSGSHIDGYKNDSRSVITYLVDPDETKITGKHIDSIAEKQGGIRPKFVQDMREVLEDKELDAITCATTNFWHTLTGIWALQAGKHAYIEKPISHNVHEGLAITAAARKYGKVVQTGTQCRSNQANIEAVAFTQSGGIGNVRFARGICYKRRKAIGQLGEYDIPQPVNKDLWFGPAPVLDKITRPNFHYDWHWQRLYGNGDLGNQGPHQTDIARWHLGITEYPKSVISFGGRLGYDIEKKDPNYADAGDTANTEIVFFDFGDKAITFEVRGLATQPLPLPAKPKGGEVVKNGAQVAVVVYGTEGFLVQVHYSYSAAYDNDGNLIREFKGGSDQNHHKNFLDAIYAGNPAAVTAPAYVGALSAGMSHLGNISYYLGDTAKRSVSVEELKTELSKHRNTHQPKNDIEDTVDRTTAHLEKNGIDLSKTPLTLGSYLEFDPDKKVFTNNSDANALLTRDYRKPYVVPKPEEV